MFEFFYEIQKQLTSLFLGKYDEEEDEENGEYNGLANSLKPTKCSIHKLPDVVLFKIFSYLSGKDLTHNVGLVCKKWHFICNTESFWYNKCLMDKKCNREHINLFHQSKIFSSSKYIYFHSLFNKNFLKNPSGGQAFSHWCCAKQINAGINFMNIDRDKIERIVAIYKHNFQAPNKMEWSIETNHHVTNTNRFFHNHQVSNNYQHQFNSYFVTSSPDLCEKMQVIDLCDETRLIRTIVDEKSLSLQLEVSEYYMARRYDFGSMYKLYVFLVGDDFNIIDNFTFYVKIPQDTESKWQNIKKVFNVNKLFRFIIFYHAGQIDQVIFGHQRPYNNGIHGIKMTNGSIRFIL